MLLIGETKNNRSWWKRSPSSWSLSWFTQLYEINDSPGEILSNLPPHAIPDQPFKFPDSSVFLSSRQNGSPRIVSLCNNSHSLIHCIHWRECPISTCLRPPRGRLLRWVNFSRRITVSQTSVFTMPELKRVFFPSFTGYRDTYSHDHEPYHTSERIPPSFRTMFGR